MATFEKRGPYQIRAKVRKLGHRTITKTFNNKRDAESWARGVEADMDRGAFIPSTIAQQTTVRKALERYQEEVFPRLARSGNDEKSRLRRLVNDMGELSLSALEASHIAKYRDRRLKDGAAPQTVKHEIGLLGRVWALKATHSITQAFDRICKRAAITGLNFHDLRHEATTRLFEQGFEIMEVASITGHKTLAMLQRYTHLRAENLAAKMR